MTLEQIAALKHFIYWSCQQAVAEATAKDQNEYRRMREAEADFDEAMKATPQGKI